MDRRESSESHTEEEEEEEEEFVTEGETTIFCVKKKKNVFLINTQNEFEFFDYKQLNFVQTKSILWKLSLKL